MYFFYTIQFNCSAKNRILMRETVAISTRAQRSNRSRSAHKSQNRLKLTIPCNQTFKIILFKMPISRIKRHAYIHIYNVDMSKRPITIAQLKARCEGRQRHDCVCSRVRVAKRIRVESIFEQLLPVGLHIHTHICSIGENV